jgi:hypothetical protein
MFRFGQTQLTSQPVGYGKIVFSSWCIGILLSIAVAGGCGNRSKLERVRVTGRASFAGKPIDIGQIRFIPIETTRAPITVENVRNGAFAAETSGGVPVGKYRVEIRMFDSEEYQNAPRTPGSPGIKQLLPAKYNRDSELTLEIPSGSGAIEHDYLLAH